MSTSLAVVEGGKPERAVTPEVMEQVVMHGDLAKLSPEHRVRYYNEVCASLGLNPLTQPFAFITLQGKMTLYAKRDCTDQLRAIHKVSVTIVARERVDDIYVVTARATLPDGRSDESTGAVPIGGLKGEPLAVALMKAETKSKRRVTLSAVGLGWLDESEADSVPSARFEPAPPSIPAVHPSEVINTAPVAPAVDPKRHRAEQALGGLIAEALALELTADELAIPADTPLGRLLNAQISLTELSLEEIREGGKELRTLLEVIKQAREKEATKADPFLNE